MRIPFDSLVFAAALNQVREAVGSRVQKVVAVSEHAVALQLFGRKSGWLTLCWHPEFFRLHLSPRAPGKFELTAFAKDLRAFLDGAVLTEVESVGRDRAAFLHFDTGRGHLNLAVELMGKHSNLVLVGSDGRALLAAKWLGKSKSVRPVLPGQPFEPIPVRAQPIDELPFVKRLLIAGTDRQKIDGVFKGNVQPVLVKGVGVYPVSVAALGLPEHQVENIGEVLDLHYHESEAVWRAEAIRSRLLGQLEKARGARLFALGQLQRSADTAARASELQMKGDLIMAFAYGLRPDQRTIETQDYEGNPIKIEINPELSPVENAQKLYDKAKRAKSGAQDVHRQIELLNGEVEELDLLINNATHEPIPSNLLALEQSAVSSGFFRVQTGAAKHPKDRPYEGKKVTEVRLPGGYMALVGGNSEANDYLTLRVARPSDLWFHVRASAGSHVILPTHNQPARIPQEILLETARIAARHSPQKHSDYVPVDYTQKRYVRKLKGGPGLVQYTHEKTLFVDPSETTR